MRDISFQNMPTTANSKPDSPWIPTRLLKKRDVGASARLPLCAASGCWINGWNVRQKINLCLLRRHVDTNVTWSWYNYYPLFRVRSWNNGMRCMFLYILITLVTVHDFISIERFDFAHAFWRCRSNGDGSTCNLCACSRFKTPEQPLSYKANDRQSLVTVTL